MNKAAKNPGVHADRHPQKHGIQKKIIVDIAGQSVSAIENGKEVFHFSCVTGDADHPTPRGKFCILGKDKIHHSRKYNAQMNYALQITTDGVYIHEGYNYITNPAEQSWAATAVSDSALGIMHAARYAFPAVAKVNLGIGNINLVGSHGCIRLAHSDAVTLFDWAAINTEVEVR